MNDIGELIRTCRKARGMTQTEVERIAMTSKGLISTYEVNGKLPRLDTLELIMSAMGYDIEIVAKDNTAEQR